MIQFLTRDFSSRTLNVVNPGLERRRMPKLDAPRRDGYEAPRERMRVQKASGEATILAPCNPGERSSELRERGRMMRTTTK
eukprot:6008342-Pyramimonas_sp.AAC.1